MNNKKIIDTFDIGFFKSSLMLSDIDKASELVIKKLESWMDFIVSMLPNFVIALLVVMIFYFIAKFLRKLMAGILHRFMENKSAIDLILTISSLLIIIVGCIIALSVLKLDQAVTSVLAGIGVIGLALGLAFQDAAGNLISGVFMAIQSPINVGDIIESNDYMGAIKKIGLRSTIIYHPQGQDVVVPNRNIFQNPYRHYTINGIRRVDLTCGISYGDNLPNVEEVVKEAIESIDYLIKDRPVEFYFTEFGDSSINFVVRYWINFRRVPDFMRAQSDGIKNIKAAFDANNITIPFPIRTLDFGIKGGEKLSEMYPPGYKPS